MTLLYRHHYIQTPYLCISFPVFPLQKRRRHVPSKKRERRPRINEEIKASKVLLVDGEEKEELTIEQALERAERKEMDLIEVAGKAKPPVVKLGDFGRYMYQQKKKERKQKAHSKQTEVKMLRFSFRTERHDLDRIVERAREFLAERHLVKLVVRLRGREMTNKQYARQKLTSLVEELSDVAEVEQQIRPQGNQFTVILRPKK